MIARAVGVVGVIAWLVFAAWVFRVQYEQMDAKYHERRGE